MKYYGLIFFLILTLSSFSQNRNKQYAIYSTIGVKAAAGSSYINNIDMSYDKNVEYKSGFQSSLGLKASLNYITKSSINSLYGLHFDYLWNRFPIAFSHIRTPNIIYTKDVTLNTGNSVLTFRYTNTKHKWLIEGGMQFSKFLNINQLNTGGDSELQSLTSAYNYKSNFTNYKSVVVGGGAYIKGLVITMRFTTSLASLNIDNASPIKDGYYNNATINPSYEKNYKANTQTTQNTVLLCFEYYIPLFKMKRDSRGKTKFSLKPIDNSYYWGNDNPYK